MSNIIPTSITNASGGVTVDVVGMTYEAFLASLGSNVFRVMELYMTASSIAQLLEQIKYNISDATGLEFQKVLNYAVDPYQKVPAYRIDLSDENIILNGQSDLQFTLLPGESLMLQLISEQFNAAEVLDTLHPAVVNQMTNDNPSVETLIAQPQNIPHDILYQGQLYDVRNADQIPVGQQQDLPHQCACTPVSEPTLNITGSLRRRIAASIKKKQNKIL